MSDSVKRISNGNACAALAVLLAISGFFAEPAAAAYVGSAVGRSKLDEPVVVIQRGSRNVRPLYSEQCEYKPVMTNEDMYRCGIFPDGTRVIMIRGQTETLGVRPRVVVLNRRAGRQDRGPRSSGRPVAIAGMKG